MQLNVDKEARKFIVATVGASVAVWGVAFEVGVWGEIFYGRLFNIWVISLAVLLAILFLPEAKAPVNWAGKTRPCFPNGLVDFDIPKRPSAESEPGGVDRLLCRTCH